jgi:protein-L-isoaspartate(D-aspartate) O-methyltransferase
MPPSDLVRAARSAGVRDPRVLDALRVVPRAAFVPADHVEVAYRDAPVPIPHGQVTTQPSLVARMVEATRVAASDRVLEVGTGYGWQTAILGRLAARVWSVERWADIATSARENLSGAEPQNVVVVVGDGSMGLLEHPPVRPCRGVGRIPVGTGSARRSVGVRRAARAADRARWSRERGRVRAHAARAGAPFGHRACELRAPLRPVCTWKPHRATGAAPDRASTCYAQRVDFGEDPGSCPARGDRERAGGCGGRAHLDRRTRPGRSRALPCPTYGSAGGSRTASRLRSMRSWSEAA